MIDLITHFKKFISQENLNNKKIVLSISGGVDSMVLLDIASKVLLSSDLLVWHLDHQHRTNSYQDAELIDKVCNSLQIKFSQENLQEKINKNKEGSWRKERIKRLGKFSQENSAQRILTAHHATDLIETMIFRLSKGTGSGGLNPFDLSTKPFWNISKNDLIIWAKNHNLEWNEDQSNFSQEFSRNKIRQKVVPVLREITPNLEKVFIRESLYFSQVEKFLQAQAQEFLQKNVNTKLKNFLTLPEIIQQEVLIIWAEKIVSTSEILDCLKWLQNNPKGNSAKIIGNIELSIRQGIIFLGNFPGKK